MARLEDFVTQNFRGPDLARIDALRRNNMLGNLDLANAQRQNAAYTNPDTTPEQFARAGLPGVANSINAEQQYTSQQRETAAKVLAQRFSAIAQSPQPKLAAASFIRSPEFQKGAQLVGLDPSQYTITDQDTDEAIRQQAADHANFLGAPQRVLSEGQTLVDAGGRPVASGGEKDTVDWKDAGDMLIPVSKKTGAPMAGLQPIPKAAKPGSGSTVAPLDPDTLDTAIAVVAANPARIRDYASFGQGGQQIRSQINAGLSQRLKSVGMTNNDLIQLRARAAAQPANLVKLTQQNAQIQQAEQLARANGQRLLDLIDLVDQTGIPLVEGITRSARAKAGNVDAGELKSVLNSFQIETARLLSGNPTMAGVISDSARNDIQHIAPDSMSAAQAKRIVNRLFTEMDIRQAAANEQLQGATSLTTVLPQAGAPSQPTPQQAAPQSAAPSSFAGPQQTPRIQSDAEYAALPSGTQYIAPDGSTRTKR